MACSLVTATPAISSLRCRAPQLSPAARPYQSGRVLLVQWSPPPRGWYKLNFDGSVYRDGSGRASIAYRWRHPRRRWPRRARVRRADGPLHGRHRRGTRDDPRSPPGAWAPPATAGGRGRRSRAGQGIFSSVLLRPATRNCSRNIGPLFRIAVAKFQDAKFRALPHSSSGNEPLPLLRVQLRPLPPLFITLLVQLLRGEETQTGIPMALQEEVHELLRCFSGCDVRHVYREGNQVAHTLCRQAYHCPGVWVGIVPSVVFDKAEEDRRGVLHERAVVVR